MMLSITAHFLFTYFFGGMGFLCVVLDFLELAL